MDSYNNNITSNNAPTLPLPAQLGEAGLGQPGSPSMPTPTGSQAVGGSTQGVNASKGASAAVGINPLVVEQGVQNTEATPPPSGMEMDASSILPAPPSMSPEAMMNSMGTVATDLDSISNVMNSFSSDVSGLAGPGSAEGKIKGDGGADETKKGEKKEGAEGKGKAGGSSPSGGSSVSRAESPTGKTTTTVSTETATPSGGVMTNTSTTTSGGASPQPSGTVSNSNTAGAPPPSDSDGCNLSTIMAEMAKLSDKQGETMAQEQTSSVNAISLQAKLMVAGALKTAAGASAMMNWAVAGLCVSMAVAGYAGWSSSSASAEADDAEDKAMTDGESSLNSATQRTSDLTDDAINTPLGAGGARTEGSSLAMAKARNSISETKASAQEQFNKGSITQEQRDSINKQMDQHEAALNDFDKNGDKTSASAINKGAKDIQSDRTANGTFSRAQLKKQGIRAGSNVSNEDAKAYIRANRTPEETAKIDTEREAAPDKDAFDEAQNKKDTEAATTFQKNVASLKMNRDSGTWSQAYQNKFQRSQIYSGAGIAGAQTLNAVGNTQNELAQAANQEDQAGSQVQGAAVQAMSAGLSQTEQVAEQLRQNQSAVAQDMSSMVMSTKV